MRSACRATLVLFLLVLTGNVAAQSMPVQVLRMQGIVERLGANAALGLSPNTPLYADDAVRTRSDARLQLGLPSGAQIDLGGASELLFHSAELIAGKPDYVLRTRLNKGIARVRGTAPNQGPAPDLRVTTGNLRLRVRDADVWLRTDAQVDLVCLIRGQVKAQLGVQNRLVLIEKPGDCLRLERASGAHEIAALPSSALKARLAMVDMNAPLPQLAARSEPDLLKLGLVPSARVPVTAQSQVTDAVLAPLAADGVGVNRKPVPVSIAPPAARPVAKRKTYRVLASRPAGSVAPAAVRTAPLARSTPVSRPVELPPPSVVFTPRAEAVSDAAPEAVDAVVDHSVRIVQGEAVPSAHAQSRGWTLVVVSLDERAAAQRYRERLLTQGFAAQVYEATVQGRRVYRVGIGVHDTASVARGKISDITDQAPELEPWPAQI